MSETETTENQMIEGVRRRLAVEMELEPDEIEEVLAIARQTLTESLGALNQALSPRLAAHAPDEFDQSVRAARAAHALKGNLLNLGLENLAASAQQLEAMIVEGAYDRARESVTPIARALLPLLNHPEGRP